MVWAKIFPGMFFLSSCYDLIHISVLLYSFFWIPRHRLCWYGHHDHLFVCWIWLLVALLCFSHILGFFVFLSVSSLTHSWVWYLVNTHRFPCLPHPFIAHWFWNMKPDFLGSFHVYLFVLCFWIPFPVSNTYLWRTGWKFMLRKDILFGFLKASNKLETQTKHRGFLAMLNTSIIFWFSYYISKYKIITALLTLHPTFSKNKTNHIKFT